MSAPCTICVFAKPPRRGIAKTRLAAVIGADAAAQLACAMFEDVWHRVTTLSWARVVLVTTDATAPEWQQCAGAEIWEQGSGDLGQRLERSLIRALNDSAMAMAVGSDSPGLPVRHFEAAYRALHVGDAVLGPALDGGFYLLGLRRCPTGLLDQISWSDGRTAAQTAQRIEQHGLRLLHIEPWLDVDEIADLQHLKRLFAGGKAVAPATQRLIAEMQW